MTPAPQQTDPRPDSADKKNPKEYKPGLVSVLAGLMWVVAIVGTVLYLDSDVDFPYGWWIAGGFTLLLLDFGAQRRDAGLVATPSPARNSESPVPAPERNPDTDLIPDSPAPEATDLIPNSPAPEATDDVPATTSTALDAPVRYLVASTTELVETRGALSQHFPYDWPDEVRHATIRSHRFTDAERLRRAGIPVGSWQEAEHSAMLWMRAHGHPDAQLTPAGPDGGVDVVAASAIAQVKHYARPVGPRPIRELAGTALQPQHHRRRLLFFSTMGYSAPALMEGRAMGIPLYQMGPGGQWVQVG
ncbi:restriction endonuclease [Kocuria oceani]|uniref:restriction endonuclease n=1 Tax=Kocuria oceani TaxID=988827 RepID=UPI00403517BC